MAKVEGALFALKAKGIIGKDFQVQPRAYTKNPDARKIAVLEDHTVEWIDGSLQPIQKYAFPISSFFVQKCELGRYFRVTPHFKPGWPCADIVDPERRAACFERLWARQAIFREVRAFWNQLTELQKGSWEIFGLQFMKEDLSNMIASPLFGFEVYMSFAMFARIYAGALIRWAPVATRAVSVKAAERSFSMSMWYWEMKKSQLRRAWVLYRKKKYTLKRVMQITQVWKKYKKWYRWRSEMEHRSDAFWRGLM